MMKQLKKSLEVFRAEEQIANAKAELNRARSVSIGNAFGGSLEISMRSKDGSHLWAIMQPVEVMEFIHQLAAGVGCHIHIVPRRDFSSWRDWKITEEELLHYRGNNLNLGFGWPPHANDMYPHNLKGLELPPPELQPGLNKERKDSETVAIEKTVKRRSTKRTAAST